ncbi:MAG TPA: hypothetical protein VGL07_18230 [Buttiauxella sp.]
MNTPDTTERRGDLKATVHRRGEGVGQRPAAGVDLAVAIRH